MVANGPRNATVKRATSTCTGCSSLPDLSSSRGGSLFGNFFFMATPSCATSCRYVAITAGNDTSLVHWTTASIRSRARFAPYTEFIIGMCKYRSSMVSPCSTRARSVHGLGDAHREFHAAQFMPRSAARTCADCRYLLDLVSCPTYTQMRQIDAHPHQSLGSYPVRNLMLDGSDSSSQKLSPPLHHLPALRQVFSVVVGGPDAVSLAVRKLPLDPVPVEAVLVQDRRR